MDCPLHRMEIYIRGIEMARPRTKVCSAIVLIMHDIEGLGWSLMAERYRKISRTYVSRDTMKRRYYEAKNLQKALNNLPAEDNLPKIKKQNRVILVKPIPVSHMYF
jgi:hypothetical protein